ncbi:MAG: hypothetical protein N838_02335 [Thiohalocapsa sp. PB-PSB1]|nr:MAG: hypothetical protein N838_02335 [Thiohalocapsa sp. PB-PSB1]HCS92994.1 hypothetical protein [Chromatiaceae bacterium]
MRILAPIGLSLLLLGGCASSPNDCRKPIGEPGLTPIAAARRAGVVGQAVTWGGTLVGSRNLSDFTELEVLAYPLDRCGRPRTGHDPLGRFIVRRPGYLETADLKPGRELTASGRIIATSDGLIGAADYRFPVLEDANPRVWSKRDAAGRRAARPWVSIGVGGGRGWGGGGVGVAF